MIKKRVHELAKELNIESKEVIKKLNQIGIEVKSHMSTIEDKEIEAIKQLYRKSSQPAEQKSTEMARTADDVNKDESSKEDKELNSSDTKKAARRRGSQNVRQRNDYSKGPGLVDRVPSRPPDRRFMEKTPEKQGRPWTPPKSCPHEPRCRHAQAAPRSLFRFFLPGHNIQQWYQFLRL